MVFYENVLFSKCYDNISRSLDQSGPMPGQEGGSERPTNFDGLVKSPSAALRFNFVVAAHL